MGKIVFWLVIVFAVLFVLRLVNASKARARREEEAARAGQGPAPTAMVRCVGCGVFLPKGDAHPVRRGAFHCGRPACAERAMRGS